MESPNDKRVLRSRQQKKQSAPNGANSLFYFDAKLRVLLEPGFVLNIANDTVNSADIFRFYGDSALVPPPSAEKARLNLSPASDASNASSGSIGKRLRSETDPLEDNVYSNFHRKMRREEKSMLNLERNDVLSEVDNLNHNLQLLHQYDWIRHLPTITNINDTNDYGELETKKKLTVAEINKILRKYDNWKRRYDKLTNDVRLFNQTQSQLTKSNNQLDIDVDEYSIPIAQLRQQRLAHKRKLLGPIIRLKLNNGFVIVYDPEKPFVSVEEDTFFSPGSEADSPNGTRSNASANASPKKRKLVVATPKTQVQMHKQKLAKSKLTPTPRKRPINSISTSASTSSAASASSGNSNALRHHYTRRKQKSDEYNSCISTPSEYQGYSTGKTPIEPVELELMQPEQLVRLDFQNIHQSNIALGLELPLGGYRDFQLYRGWLVKANDFLNQRLAFRAELERLIPDSQDPL